MRTRLIRLGAFIRRTTEKAVAPSWRVPKEPSTPRERRVSNFDKTGFLYDDDRAVSMRDMFAEFVADAARRLEGLTPEEMRAAGVAAAQRAIRRDGCAVDCRVYWGHSQCTLPRGHDPERGHQHHDGHMVAPEDAYLFGEDLTEGERCRVAELWEGA